MKQTLLKTGKNLLEILSKVVLIMALAFVLSRLLEQMRFQSSITFRAMPGILVTPIFALVLSLIFTYKHLRSLLFQKIKINFVNMFIALLLIVLIYINMVPMFFETQFIRSHLWWTLNIHADIIIHLFMWNNLFYAFRVAEKQ